MKKLRKNALLVFSLLIIVVAFVPLYLKIPEVSNRTQLRKFASYEELKNFLKASSQVGPFYDECARADKEVKMNNLENLGAINEVELP